MARRRAPGEGTIRRRNVKRKDGSTYVRYAAIVTLGYDASGQQLTREGPSRKTEREALRDLGDLKAQRDAGFLSDRAQSTLRDYLNYWLAQRGDLRERSLRAYRDDVARFIAPALGHIKLNALSPTDIQSFQTDLQKSSPFVARRVRACLSAALTQAVQWQLLASNPVIAVANVKLPEADPSIWQPEQIRRFLEVAAPHPLYALYALTLGCGLRLGEVRGLQWRDVSTNVLHIRRQLSGDRAEPNFGPPKTKKSNRRVPIPGDVLVALAKHRQAQEDARQSAGERWRDHGLLFTTSLGTPLSGAKIRDPFKRLAQKAALPKIRFHDLRHTAASLWIAKGLDVATVAARLGHSDMTTTLRIYAHAFDERLERRALTLEELLE